MATNTNGGTTASFSNTPQATNDSYAASEDQIYYFDVMADDLGGNAKVLWSIDDTTLDGTTGVSGSSDGTLDLTVKDAVNVSNYSDCGARMWITADGKVGYDASVFNYLGAGETKTDHFTYAIRLASGTLSWATVTVTITGSNDGPDIFLATADSASAARSETNSGLTSCGTLSVSDPDTSDTVNVTVTGVSVGGTGNAGTLTSADLKAMLSLTGANANAADGTAGSLGWKFDSGTHAFDNLAAGQTLVLTYTLTGNDGHGGSDTQQVTINITGSNDAAVIADVGTPDTAVVEAGGVNNGTAGDASAGGTLSVSDVDDGESSFVANSAASLNGTYGTFTFNEATGAWTYTLDDTRAATQGLTQNQPATDTLIVHSADGTAHSVVVNITGTNDAAVITGNTSGSITEDAVPNTVIGDLNSTDVDGTADSWTVVSSPTSSAGGYGTYTVDATGHWTYVLDNTNSFVNGLNNGQQLFDNFTVTTADGTSQVVKITINGHTDATDTQSPTDIVFSLAASTGSLSGNGINTGMTLGSFTAVDADSTSWSFSIGSVSGQTLPAVTVSPGSGGSVNLVTNGSVAAGQYGFSVTATDPAGHSYTETYTLSVGTQQGDGSAAFTITNGTTATNGTDISLGLNGGDTIKGGGGDDALVGGNGNDFLYGGLGNDQLVGGQGNDTYVFDTAPGSGNVDTIFDFNAGGAASNQGVDIIQLDHSVFTGLSLGALQAGVSYVSNNTGAASGTHAQIIFNSTTGDLYYDPDGTGGQAAVLFAHLDSSGFSGTLDPSDFNIA